METDITITLPMSWHALSVILTAAGIAAMTGLIFLTLGEHERKRERAPLGLLTAFAWLLLPVWLLIFAGTLWQVWHLLTGAPSMLAGRTPLGTGALLAALLGAPFVVWGAVLRQRTVDFQKEGHITERITAAVEQLGAEKSVKKIVDGATQETSEPNIEVRIGAILSLERIAQDSTRYDKGRDHVRVMEILCAYVRENSNARPPRDFPLPDWGPLPDEATREARAAHEVWREARLANRDKRNARQWAGSLPAPRADITQALQVLGRRTADQRRVEAAWPDAPQTGTVWPFDAPVPELREGTDAAPLTGDAIGAFKERVGRWRDTLHAYSGYRLDLRGANLQAADLSAKRPDASDAVFSGALLHRARMEGANLIRTRMEGAALFRARMEGADLWAARMDSTTSLTAAILDGAALRDVDFATVAISAEQVTASFGDASVILPEGMDRPAHWSDQALPLHGDAGFLAQWRKWRVDPKGYPPLPKPDD